MRITTAKWWVKNTGAQGRVVFDFKCTNLIFRFLHYVFKIEWILTADDIREMYYRVLDLKMPQSKTIQEEVDAVSVSSYIDIDVPEDILRLERQIELLDGKKKGK